MEAQGTSMEVDLHLLGHLDCSQLRAIEDSKEYSTESTLQIGVAD